MNAPVEIYDFIPDDRIAYILGKNEDHQAEITDASQRVLSQRNTGIDAGQFTKSLAHRVKVLVSLNSGNEAHLRMHPSLTDYEGDSLSHLVQAATMRDSENNIIYDSARLEAMRLAATFLNTAGLRERAQPLFAAYGLEVAQRK